MKLPTSSTAAFLLAALLPLAARAGINQEEDNREAHELHHRAHEHLDKAIHAQPRPPTTPGCRNTVSDLNLRAGLAWSAVSMDRT